MPCELCNDLEKRYEEDVRSAFDFAPDELSQSAYAPSGRGCDACLVILEGIRQFEDAEWSLTQDVKRVYARCREHRSHQTDSLLLELYFKDERPKLLLELYSLQPHAWKAILPRSSVSGHPLSGQALHWVRSLLDECTRTHVSCSKADIPQLPKRLLALQRNGDNTVGVKLIENLEGETGIYVALSHCWGEEQACTTTRASLQDRKSSITWTSIPKTFKDAINFALALDIQLLWIDSLCIIQDDTIDWETESSNMADIYQHAFLTLAATSSSGDADGCFPDEVTPPLSIEIVAPEATADTARLGIRKALRHWDDVDSGGAAQEYPLLSRAWALQERLLAPRILHFCDSELIWECRERTKCECGAVNQNESPCGDFHEAFRRSHEIDKQRELDRQEANDMLIALELQQQDEADWKNSQDNEIYFDGLTMVNADLIDPAGEPQDLGQTRILLGNDKESADEEIARVGEKLEAVRVTVSDEQDTTTVVHPSAETPTNAPGIFTADEDDEVEDTNPEDFKELENRLGGLHDYTDLSKANDNILGSKAEVSQDSGEILTSPQTTETRHEEQDDIQAEQQIEDAMIQSLATGGINVDAYLTTLPAQSRAKQRRKQIQPIDEDAFRLWPLRYDIVDRPISLEGAQNTMSLQDILRETLQREPSVSIHVVQHFHRIVERYSALCLTRPSDRLPALSGLCERLRHMRGDFCAGLWSHSLGLDMMWRVNALDPNRESSGRSPVYRGPTWSWVSVESPVSYWSDITDVEESIRAFNYGIGTTDEDFGEHISPVSVKTELAGCNPFGEVRSCSLVVRRFVKEARLEYTYTRYDSAQPAVLDPTKYNVRLESKSVLGKGGVEIDEIPFYADYLLALDGPHQVPDGQRVALLFIYPTVALVLRVPGDQARSQPWFKFAIGDLLHRWHGDWERIGIARLSNTVFYDYRLDWMRVSTTRELSII